MEKATDKNAAASAQEAVAPRKSKAKLLIMALLVLMTAAAGFFGWKFYSSAKTGAAPASTEAGAESAEASAAGGEHGKAGVKGDPANESAVINFEPFLVNLADHDAFRYLRVTVRLQVVNKGAAETITANEVFASRIRDTILGALSTKVAADIVEPEGKEVLKTEIMEKLNVFLPEKPVKAVFFTDFVVQL